MSPRKDRVQMNIRIDENFKKRVDSYFSEHPKENCSEVVRELLSAYLDGGQGSIFEIARKVRNTK